MTPVELVGQQIRIRVADPDEFRKDSRNRGTQDVGRAGRLQRVAGRKIATGKWATQSWRLNLAHYHNFDEVERELRELRYKGRISGPEYRRALKRARTFMRERR